MTDKVYEIVIFSFSSNAGLLDQAKNNIQELQKFLENNYGINLPIVTSNDNEHYRKIACEKIVPIIAKYKNEKFSNLIQSIYFACFSNQ